MSLGNQFDMDVSNHLFNVLQMLYIYNDYVTVCIKFTKNIMLKRVISNIKINYKKV